GCRSDGNRSSGSPAAANSTTRADLRAVSNSASQTQANPPGVRPVTPFSFDQTSASSVLTCRRWKTMRWLRSLVGAAIVTTVLGGLSGCYGGYVVAARPRPIACRAVWVPGHYLYGRWHPGHWSCCSAERFVDADVHAHAGGRVHVHVHERRQIE